jgi:hypothetical protein
LLRMPHCVLLCFGWYNRGVQSPFMFLKIICQTRTEKNERKKNHWCD